MVRARGARHGPGDAVIKARRSRSLGASILALTAALSSSILLESWRLAVAAVCVFALGIIVASGFAARRRARGWTEPTHAED